MTVNTAEYFVGRKKFSGASYPERNETAGAHCIAVSDLDLYKSYGLYQAKREYNPSTAIIG